MAPDRLGRVPRTRSAESDEYAHLHALLVDYASTPTGAPERAGIREQIVTGYLPVARNIAYRYAQRGEPVADLIQVACLGLVNAVDRFEPGYGHNFLSFAIPTMTGEIRRHFRDRTWMMRVPRRLKELQSSVTSAASELSTELNRSPRPGEIATRLEVSVDEVLDALQAADAYRARSLDEALPTGDDSGSLSERLGEPEPKYDQFTDSHAIAPHLAALPARERGILHMRFYQDMTQTQIAERVGISQMHVSRILAATLSRLRDAVQNDVPVPKSVGEAHQDPGEPDGAPPIGRGRMPRLRTLESGVGARGPRPSRASAHGSAGLSTAHSAFDPARAFQRGGADRSGTQFRDARLAITSLSAS